MMMHILGGLVQAAMNRTTFGWRKEVITFTWWSFEFSAIRKKGGQRRESVPPL
jgi:hypothetical protein